MDREFPKLKTAQIIAEERPLDLNEARAGDRIPPYFGWIVAMFVGQLVLFFITLNLLIRINKPLKTSPPVASMQATAAMPASAHPPVAPAPVLTTNLIADFDGTSFVTNHGTAVSVIPDSVSQAVVRLALDASNRFGANGKALQINFDFTKHRNRSAGILIALPDTSIGRSAMLEFRMKAPHEQARLCNLKIFFIDEQGGEHIVPIEPIYGFWTKYEVNLSAISGKSNPLKFREIRFIVEHRDPAAEKGTWLLDQLMLNQRSAK